MLRALLLPLLLATVAICQDAAERCAAALLRGDFQAAAEAATSATDPAVRARLQAALLPPSRRPAAMLAVASHYPNSAQADQAILAGAAAVLVLRDYEALPELAAWNNFECMDDEWDWLPSPVIQGLWRQLEKRRAQDGDLAILAEAEQALLRCSVSRFGFDPARVAPNATWSLPERREALRLRAWQRQPGRITWADAIPRVPPDREVLLPVVKLDGIAGLPSGDWLIELSSTTTRWRSVRAVEVSDLDVITLADRDRVAMAAWRNGKAIPTANWWLTQNDASQANGITGDPAAMLVHDKLRDGGELFVSAEGQRARIALRGADDRLSAVDRWQVHLMVDRPIYKPGEKIQGRLVLRETNYEGTGVDAVADAAACANRDIELRAFKGSKQVRLAGRTDANGVWSFTVQAPAPSERTDATFSVHLPNKSTPIYKGHPCEVTDFHRPALMLEVDGATVIARDRDTAAALHATWASGAPASGLRVDATVRVWPTGRATSLEHYRLATDALGIATLQLPLKSLAATFVRINFRVETPAGPKQLTHTIDTRVNSNVAGRNSWPRRDGPRLLIPEVAVVGQPLQVRVRGIANDTVLFVTGRGRRARQQSIQLDEHGAGKITVVPTRAEWPALDLAVAGHTRAHQERIPLLLRPAKQPEISLPEATTPGASVACQVATGLPGTVVTVAVVDERTFAIADDRTPEPNVTLRPTVAAPYWRHAASAKELSPEQLLAALLEHGRIPTSDLDGKVAGGSGAPSTGGPAGPSAGQVRTDFRATAAFKTVITNADGLAKFDLQLPHDLTTWRVSLVGIAADGIGFQERRQIVTRVPLAAEPALPRVLRVGDSVEVPIIVDRKAKTGDDTAVKLTATCVDAVATVANGDYQVAVAGGTAARALVTLRGMNAGVTKLALSASVGEFEDRSLRPLPVHDDAIKRPVSAVAMAVGNVSVTTPAGTTGDLEVTVLGGSSATWAALERRLSTYPYGCVEQTLAKLLPFFAAARGAKIHGTAPPVASKEFTKRLQAGLLRMRQLQASNGGAFAFWPGGSADLHMTALVLHGLATMREGGLDPARFGLTCDLQREPFLGAIRKVTARNGRAANPAEQLQIELACAGLRMHATAAHARAAVTAAINIEQALPTGLLLRAGLALVTAGDTELATVCLRRATEQHGKPIHSRLPGENSLAVRALQLELQCLLQPGSASVELATEVLLGGLNGYSTTYAQACALSASALAMPRVDAKPFEVELQAGTDTRALTLSPDNGFTARVRIPSALRCSVTGPDGQQLIVRTAGHKREVGSKHGAWSNPLVVERDLCRRNAKANSKQRCNKEDLVPITGGSFAAGQVIWLRLRVSSPQTMRYVVVNCPLPAGFEPMQDLPWLERFDDRIALSCGTVDSYVTEYVVPLIPTLVGTMVWPPTTAEPMYANGFDGGTAGSKLTVVMAVAEPDLPTQIACFAKLPVFVKPKVVARTAWNRVDSAMSDLRHAFDSEDDEDNKATLAAALKKAMKACDELRVKKGEHDYVLEKLTEAIESWRYRVGDDAVDDPMRTARTSTLLALVELHHDCVAQTMELFERDVTGKYDRHYVQTLIEALLIRPGQAVRESLLAKVIELAASRDEVPQGLFAYFESPIEHDHLRSVLKMMLATHTRSHGEYILELLPREDLRGIAPTVLMQAADDYWPSWLVEVLLSSPLGQAELARSLRNPDVVAAQAEILVATLPASYWRTVPITTFAMLDRQDVEGFPLAATLAASTNTTEDVQQELIRTTDVQWQATLAKALVRRGVRNLGGLTVPASEDSFAAAWQQALSLPADDATGALQLLTTVEEEIGADPLADFLRTIIVRSGSTTQLTRILQDLEEDEVAELFARLDATATQALLSITPETICPLPPAHSTADCAALWAYAERLEDHGEVLSVFCRSEMALHFAIKQIAAVQDKELRESLQYGLRRLRELDTETGLPPADEPWLPLLQSVAHRGVQPNWTASQRQRYDRIRRLRGVR